ncbi:MULTISPECIES: HPP family protein [unclassified Haladaptatus]|uniref:HPP family protein n=1 Tax=unclassified Haladaptatus TaxID=2622732 RepID=UPI002FCDF3AC
MLDTVRKRAATYYARFRRLERRRIRDLRRWVESTRNLIHLTVVVLVPLLIATVTAISNSLEQLSFLLFPPLAAGTYTLFADPEGKYSKPGKFVAGLTIGALCGWGAFELVAISPFTPAPTGQSVSAISAGLGIFLTALSTWVFDIEEPSAFSTALLTLVAGSTQFDYVLSVAASSAIVALAFVFWKQQFYERRARFLYQSTKGDDHVLVPMRGAQPETSAMFGARLAAAHDAGKVVLLDIVDDEAIAAAEAELLDHDAQVLTDGGEEQSLEEQAETKAATDAAADLEAWANRLRTKVGVPVEVVVAVDGNSPAQTVIQTAQSTNCDLIVTPYEERHGALSPFVRTLFRSEVDVAVHRSVGGRTRWKHILVPIRQPSDVAHAMIDFGLRLAGRTGRVSVANCITAPNQRRAAENMLADLVDAFEGNLETRVSRATIETFLAANAPQYDAIFLGASTDRSAASRLISPPTFERIHELESDVVIVDRGKHPLPALD